MWDSLGSVFKIDWIKKDEFLKKDTKGPSILKRVTALLMFVNVLGIKE